MAGMAQMGRCHLRLLGSLSQQRFIFFVSYEWVHLGNCDIWSGTNYLVYFKLN
jgi:hypothetical protein